MFKFIKEGQKEKAPRKNDKNINYFFEIVKKIFGRETGYL